MTHLLSRLAAVLPNAITTLLYPPALAGRFLAFNGLFTVDSFSVYAKSLVLIAAVVSIFRSTRRLADGSREAVISRNGTSASFGPIPISSTRNVSIAPAAVMDVSSISQLSLEPARAAITSDG